MKLRNLSLVLFFAACGGGKDPVVIIDSPTGGDGGGVFPNSRNDVFHVLFTDGLVATPTPDTGDAPDNSSAAFTIGATGGTGIAGEMGIAGDKSDSYSERDTYLLTTDATVNEITIREDWTGGDADIDYLLFFEPDPSDTEFESIGGGTAIHNGVDPDDGTPLAEFATFTVAPSDNYYLWTGVFSENAAPGGSPTLPKLYDLSVYGSSFSVANVAGTCAHTETGTDAGATDANNAITRFGGTGTKENSGVSLTGTQLFCGTLRPRAFLPDPANAMIGSEDVDVFSINVATSGDFALRVIGETEQDQTAINTLIAKGALQAGLMNEACVGGACPDTDPDMPGTQIRREQFWGLATHTGSHGVDAFFAENSTFDPVEMGTAVTDQVGPKTIAIFVRSEAPGGQCAATNTCAPVLVSDIKYRIQVMQDNRNTRAPIKTGDKTEANDN